MNTSIPKIFISYSWSAEERVLELAERLTTDGVDVVLDKWDLSEGQDKYVFMEQSVTDDSISKVLIICDKAYADKANNRAGGVGDETMIMSAEIYGKANQEKFIPLIFERDEDGKEYAPAYLKSRIYIDFSDNDKYESNYERLLRNLHNKPEHSKPRRGKMPEWLNEETISLTPIRATIKQLQSLKDEKHSKRQFLLKKFNNGFTKALIDLTPVDDEDFDANLLKQIETAKPLRDLFFDYVETLISEDLDIANTLGEFFEQFYNSVYKVEGRSSYSNEDFEFGFFILWEMFIGSIAVLLYYEKYQEIYAVLNRIYFLNDNAFSSNLSPSTFVKFRYYCRHLETIIKRKHVEPNLYTLAGEIVSKREKSPLLNANSFANADIILYQLSECLGIKNGSWCWFPLMYCYHRSQLQSIWSKMVSVRHCKQIFSLFNIDTIDKLKEIIQLNKPDMIRYDSAFDYAPAIISSIDLDKIATLP